MELASHFVGAGGAVILALIAFSIVFLVLIGLSFIIVGNKCLSEVVDNRKKQRSTPAASKPAVPTVSQAVSAGVSQSADEENLIAVLTAAVAATLGSAVTVTNVRPVFAVSRQAGSGNGWRALARTCNLEGRGF
ncbi:OadG family protein [Aminiphilus sp.]|jgi:Na+-transporting methylmalonyl-CoA/oxaloacetate decarboxylase gamma subunit|uniref:OadG family protein n=1 Tax=Aminiphilus sp. TaxID=1872488 RepID=UPI0026300777|nr:OadG family protein [Aminiphilus sp.]